jgi:pilus assembly protein TadC
MKLFKFLPMKDENILRLSRIFLPLGSSMKKMFPNLETFLVQLGVKISPEEYIASSVFSSVLIFVLFFSIIFSLGILNNPIYQVLKISLLSSISFSIMVLAYYIIYPRIVMMGKVKFLEKDLLSALRYMYIKVKSGVSLYDAMVGVAYGNFGEVSKEFKKAVKEISGGVDEATAMENMALRNPSLYFRRIVWQIANNLRSGSEISDVLENITKTLSKEHKILIRKYGSELNPIILMYMMFTVVIPSLGITVIVVMSSFSGISVPKYIFYLIPASVLVLQLFFISLIKNKRPLMVI